MSTYKKITRHPNNGAYFNATWHDDYFGHHLYGVEFPGDKVVYPLDMIEKAQLKEFWVEDVLKGFQGFLETINRKNVGVCTDETERDIIELLKCINIAYKQRWERDPIEGEGALENLQKKRGK